VRGDEEKRYRCPICGYSLRGLPQRCRCPECGHDCATPLFVFERDVAYWKWYALANLPLFLIGLLFLVVRGSYTLLLVAGIGVVGGGCRVLMQKRKIVVTPEDLQVIVGSEVRRTLPLSAIRDCIWSRVDGSVKVLDRSGNELASIPRSFFWSHRAAKGLAEKVRGITKGAVG